LQRSRVELRAWATGSVRRRLPALEALRGRARSPGIDPDAAALGTRVDDDDGFVVVLE
jgi:hypothetical protein